MIFLIVAGAFQIFVKEDKQKNPILEVATEFGVSMNMWRIRRREVF